jgi:hypothetical protein
VFDHRVATMFSRWPHFLSTAPDIAYAYVQDYRTRRPDLYHQHPTLSGLAGRAASQIQAESGVQSGQRER